MSAANSLCYHHLCSLRSGRDMSYPGDPNLDPQIQERVLGTLEQTSQLAADGKVQEARLGCDFMLRLDPLFTPALVLQQRLADATGPVETGDLTAAAAAEAPSDPEVLKTVRLSKEELEALMAEGEPPPVETGPASAPAPPPAPEAPASEAAAQEATDRQATGTEETEIVADLQSPLSNDDPVPSTPDTDRDGSDKIETLLGEGQAAFDDERYQEAIDSWSRIFLIDIDHEEATRRIDLARQLNEERDRQVEEIFHQAVGFSEDGRTEDAIAAFNRVLRIQPNNVAARDYLEGLQSGDASSAVGEAQADQEGVEGTEAAAERPAAADAEPASADIDQPPRVADPTYRMSARAKGKPINPFFAIGSGVFAIVLIAAWLLFSNWGRLFPNVVDEATDADAERMARITQLYADGSQDEAMGLLMAIGSSDKDFLEARRLLAQWEAELEARVEPEAPLLTGEEEERHQSLISDGRTAYDDREYLQAAQLFTKASLMAPLSAAEAALLDDSMRQLEPLAQQIDLYQQRQWELALPTLWRHLDRDPGNRDVISLLTSSYYNLTVRELRRGEPQAAEEHAEEASRLSPDDEQIARLNLFVKTYLEYPRDLLYDIYVGELAFRR